MLKKSSTPHLQLKPRPSVDRWKHSLRKSGTVSSTTTCIAPSSPSSVLQKICVANSCPLEPSGSSRRLHTTASGVSGSALATSHPAWTYQDRICSAVVWSPSGISCGNLLTVGITGRTKPSIFQDGKRR